MVDLLPCLIVQLLQIARNQNARIVKEAVEPPITLHYGIGERTNLRRPRNVAGEELSAPPRLSDTAHDIVAALFAAPNDNDLRSLGGKEKCGGAADAGRCSRDEDYFIL